MGSTDRDGAALMDRQSLPTAHPRFQRHFRHSIYDTDRAGNDDVLPFGTDEGFDTVWEWAERSEELRADPRVDLILGGGMSAMLQEALAGDQDSAALLIAAGFTLLRYTGSIDPVGRQALRLTLLDAAARNGDASQMLDDLDSFEVDQQRSGMGRQSMRKRDRAPRPWLVIMGPPNDRPHNRWLQRIADSVMADKAWQRWWDSSSRGQLVLRTSPLGPPEGILRVELDEPERLCLIGTHPDVVSKVRRLIEVEDASAGDRHREHQWGPIQELVPNGPDLYRQLILTMLGQAARHLDMPDPPGRLPDQS